jgi:hypothetical protein
MKTLTPDVGIELPPLSKPADFLDLKVRALAACKTAELLAKESRGTIPLEEDAVSDIEKEIVATLTAGYAEDPESASKMLNEQRMSQMTPASIRMVSSILSEFGNLVVADAVRIRNLVTNKLLLETENDDAKIRIRALELLGKISDVGLFAEKHEVTHTHKTSDELRESLRAKLSKFTASEANEAVDAEYEVV